MDLITPAPPFSQAWAPIGLSTAYNFSEELYLSSNTGSGDITWPTASLMVAIPFYVQAPGYAQQFWWANGSSVAGNVLGGIYDEYGNLIAAIPSTAQTTVSVPQAVAFVSPVLLPCGRYYIALVSSVNTSKFTGWTTGAASTNVNRLLGISEQTLLTFALPTTLTFAVSARSFVPIVGVTYSSLAI